MSDISRVELARRLRMHGIHCRLERTPGDVSVAAIIVTATRIGVVASDLLPHGGLS